MSRNASTGSLKNRPLALQTTKSFSRYEPSQSPPSSGRSRASTAQSPPDSTGMLTESPLISPTKAPKLASADIFEKTIPEGEEPTSPDLSKSQSLPERFEELPIELISLTDRFVESLSAKAWNEPPSIDRISDIFQEFYIKAASHISTHISTLLTRLHRDGPPTPSRTSTKTKSIDESSGTQQMLTASEVSERRKARRLLEYKRVVLEEAVEKRTCEQVYDKIWRHKSTLDEVRDEKLRSKTAALALVGIGLKDLGIELDSKSEKTEEDIQEALAPAREGLAKMNNEHYPLGKLQHLTEAHKSIVETLSTIYPSSNSADEILPTLIYALITSPMEGINIIGNLFFIQRFRAAAKVDGEAAYCLTNLEAAISFLENVDLTSLRADEVPEGPPKLSSRPSTPFIEKSDPFPSMATTGPSISSQKLTTSTTTSNASGTGLQMPNLSSRPLSASPLPSPRHQRTLSNLLKPSASAFNAASSTARNTAEEGIKTISTTLDSSFKFLFGSLQQRKEEDPTNTGIILPKTLDEARALVSTGPLSPPPDDDALASSETSSIAEKDTNNPMKDDLVPLQTRSEAPSSLLTALGGRKGSNPRERSVDSTRSTGSGSSFGNKRVGFAATAAAAEQNRLAASRDPLESVKNLGSSLNPLTHLGTIGAFGGGFRGFGSRPAALATGLEKDKEKERGQLIIPTPTAETIEGLIRMDPPVTRFMEMENVGELRVGDLEQLLREYQRVAGVLRGLSEGRME